MRHALLIVWVSVTACSAQTGGLTKIATPTNYTPPSASDRVKWFASSTFGPASLAAGVINSAWGTAFNSPPEYGTHWEGFGRRYGMRLTGVSTGNAMEAGLGALWGEDPRYDRLPGQPIKTRIGHAIKMSFMAKGRDGSSRPAYARYAATAGNNFLSNAWREPSEAGAAHAAMRTGYGFLGRMGGNAFNEFWPEVKNLLFRRK